MAFKSLEITFSNEFDLQDEIVLSWDLLPTISSVLWQKKLISTLSNQDQKIFTWLGGFPDSYRDREHLKNCLNKTIDYINQNTTYKIDRYFESYNQKDMNYFHHQFEIMTGQVWKLPEFYKSLNENQKKAVSALNYYIHQIELNERILELPEEHRHLGTSSIMVDFPDAHRMPLPEFCLDDFTLNSEFGDVVLHYAQTGKTWLEVFLDHDEEIDVKSIQPLQIMTGEFDIFFGKPPFDQKFKEKLLEMIEEKGGDRTNPKNALGYNVVAKFKKLTPPEMKHLKSQFSKRQVVTKIRLVHEQQKDSFERVFSLEQRIPQDYILGI
ncbi:MAG: hypothetical protein COW00_01550 [Bdellovibrio sp. CG12_big_fil_rev_8_21_14_0_65_39_13]|nr:MAG: hypothetical protein COW78_03300 [Bdellovibrio sp. CG22_combo_CG10-13_8_21_14_all_39_27]PIQ62396.1 MAG: hypothetical protein COW00_01550 [Bdellovibrio sp. CG12_big_fil_rev_8_21_14_0_65_39_13]PIR34061.1 MAG: hypothetical protein COV37_14030 [Bdellovibrio sp. CG11_big_fil_rev_8_21_14_0_20_39_38]